MTAIAVAMAALAHLPYVRPSAFGAARDQVTILASFGEDVFRPDVAMRTPHSTSLRPTAAPSGAPRRRGPAR